MLSSYDEVIEWIDLSNEIISTDKNMRVSNSNRFNVACYLFPHFDVIDKEALNIAYIWSITIT